MGSKEKQLDLKTAKQIIERADAIRSIGGTPRDPRFERALEIVKNAAAVTSEQNRRAQRNTIMKQLSILTKNQPFSELVRGFCTRPSMLCQEFREPGRCMYHNDEQLKKIIAAGRCDVAWVNYQRGTMTIRDGFINPRIPTRR